MSSGDIWQQTTKRDPVCRTQNRASGETESDPSTLGMKAAAGDELETHAAARHSSAERARVRSQEQRDSGPPRVGQTRGPEGTGGSQAGKGEAQREADPEAPAPEVTELGRHLKPENLPALRPGSQELGLVHYFD